MTSAGAEKVLMGVPSDGITRVTFSPESNNLLVSSWDSVSANAPLFVVVCCLSLCVYGLGASAL